MDYSNLSQTLSKRRQRLAQLIDFPVILWSGQRSPRNYPGNPLPFRASSHFLYFAGIPLEKAAIRLNDGALELFIDDAPPGSALWHGEMPKSEEIAGLMGADGVFPLSKLPGRARGAATVGVQSGATYSQQSQILNRPVAAAKASTGIDGELVQAIITLRLCHDEAAIEELKKAAQVTVAAHKAGMAATPDAKLEAGVRGAMEGAIVAENLTFAYPSIVTVHGEVFA